MNPIQPFLPTPQTVLYLGNVALAVLWSCAAASLVALVGRWRSAPTRHSVLLLGLVLVLTSPGLVWLAGQAGIGLFQVALSEQRKTIDETVVASDTPRPTLDVRQQPPAMGRKAAQERPAFAGEHAAFIADRPAIVPDRPVEPPHNPRCEPAPPDDQVANPEQAASSAEAPWWWPIAQGLALVWALGTATSLLWLARSLLRLAAFCRELREHPADGMRQTVEQAALQAGLVRAPRLFVSARTAMPVTFGLLRPAIVLPDGFADDLPPAQLHAVMLHEMAHVARRDPWVGLAQRLAAALYWWCPPVFRLNKRLTDLREEVCDNYVLRCQGDGVCFAEVLVTLAERVIKASPLPATSGVFEYRPARERSRALEHRIRRLLCTETNPMTRTSRVGVALVVLGGLGTAAIISLSHVGATEAVARAADVGVADSPARSAESTPGELAPSTKAQSQPSSADHAIRGVCTDDADGTPLAGVRLKLVAIRGLVGLAEQVAEAVSDDSGRFEFVGLSPPKPQSELDPLAYGIAATVEGRPTAFVGEMLASFKGREMQIVIGRETATLRGKVIDVTGRPVPGATVAGYSLWGRPVPDACCAVTDANGEFSIAALAAKRGRSGFYVDKDGKWQISRLPAKDGRADAPREVRCNVLHPEYPKASTVAVTLPARIECTLPAGCMLSGEITDHVTGEPAVGVVVAAQNLKAGGETVRVLTDADGRYRLVVAQGNYNVLAHAEGRVCVAITDHECPAGQSMELPPLKMIRGGLIAGRILNTATGKPVSISQWGDRILVSLYGPSRPGGRVITGAWLAEADDDGRFVLRAAPGDNFPYLINQPSNRMASDTCKQDPVVVVEGETIQTEILITPPVPPEQKTAVARRILAALPKNTTQRVEGILEEFRKLNHTVDETAIWCLLTRELVTIGSDAVPQLCAELDATTQQRMIRRLGVALRAIDDPRAIPALIRAIPKTLQPPMSDYGLLVEDAALRTFMQEIDLGNRRGQYFSLGRPVREVFGALHKLTKQDFQDDTLFSVFLSDGAHRQSLQRQLYRKQAERWQRWWEAHWREFTDDESYRLVHLPPENGEVTEPPDALGSHPKIGGGGAIGMILSPSSEKGMYVDHFLDLDTGSQPRWPGHIPQEEAGTKQADLAHWAAQTGVDLMCVTHRPSEGKPTYALRAFNMRVKEISLWDAENIERRLQSGKIPEAQPAGELLLHYDTQAQKYVPDANAAFIYVTREGGTGLIHVTDRVIRKGHPSAYTSSPTKGVGFQKGLRFNHRTIIR